MTTATTTDTSLAALRQKAERLGIPGFARMRKAELIEATQNDQRRD